MMLEWTLVALLSYGFPSYFDNEQQINSAIIIDKSIEIGADPYLMVAIAWVESRIKVGRISKTGDYGIFQINYRFWGKRWGYDTPSRFLVDMSSPGHATVAAAVVLKEMRKYKACRGLNLPACYNGGPGWQRSKNKRKIVSYATKVHKMRLRFMKGFPGWKTR